jgi:hypothetical protein
VTSSEPDGHFGIPAIGTPGRAAAEVPAGPPPEPEGGADHEISTSSFPGIEVRAASIRGLMHRYRQEPRQDRYSLLHDAASERLLISVCDGVGEMALSHDAAALVARWMPREYLAHGEWTKAIAAVNERLAGHAEQTAAAAPAGSEPHTYGMATTFVGVALSVSASPRIASLAWTDDSTVWRLDGEGWTKLTPDPTSSDSSVHRTSVRALPHRQPRFHTVDVAADHGALFVMSDGVGVPLESAAQVRDTLARWWTTPPDPFTFARQVGFARKGHMDDRTVVGIWFAPGNEPQE